MTFISTSALSPMRREIISTQSYTKLIDFLTDRYPNGFDMPTDIFTSFKKIDVDDYDMKLDEDVVIILIERPAIAAALGLTGIMAWLVNTAVLMAVNFAISKLFAPSAPEERQAPSSVYSLNNSQNQAKLGQPIPVGYGKFRMYPSYVEQPYYRYEGNQEYLYLLLCIGQGKYNVDKLQIDDLDVTNRPFEVQYKKVTNGNFGNIQQYVYNSSYNMRNNLLSTPFNMEIVSSPESEKYNINSAAKYVEVDYSFPQGLYSTNKDGATKNSSAWLYINIYSGTTKVKSVEFAHVGQRTIEHLRYTRRIAWIPSYTHITISRRNNKSKVSSYVNTMFVNRVKELYPNENVTNYGDITLLWVRIKATNAISSAGQQQVNGFFTRTDVGNKISDVLTDIYSNKEYGGKLNVNDLYLGTASESVNAVFENKQTVIDAMKQVSKSQKYTVYPVGQDILLKKDAPNNITTALFNETNIVRDTFSISYNFKNEIEKFDSIECTYRTGSDWNISVERYPASGISPNTVELFGVTDINKAKEMAKYLYKQDNSRRKVITFDTDIQFLTLEFLDKIKISHSAVVWGQAGNIIEVNGNTVTVSELVDKDSNITIRNTDGSVSDALSFTKVSDFEISIPGVPSWVQSDLGYTIGIAKEYLVTSVRPKDENYATTECIEYDSGIYT